MLQINFFHELIKVKFEKGFRKVVKILFRGRNIQQNYF